MTPTLRSSDTTLTDMFCGLGGSSSGGEMVPGVRVVMAMNHWKLACDAHAENFPHAKHDTADVSTTSPRRYPRTTLLWASPECTHHTYAGGNRKSAGSQPDLFGDVLPDEAAERSRATMWDVLRFAEHHRYAGGVVENVVQVRDWVLWPSWTTGLQNLGYDYRVVYMNSMFASAGGLPAPQSRDRLYVVFWCAGDRRPDFDKWTRPVATCTTCGQTGRAIQAWKHGDRPWGKYREQYVWRCESCIDEVHPAVLPAAVAIDWSMPGGRIGDRPKPLGDKTMERIGAGLRRYARPIHLEAAGNTYESGSYIRAWPVDEPFRTMHTSASKGLACPPLIVDRQNTSLQGNYVRVWPVTQPIHAVVCRDADGLLIPPILVPAGGTWNEDASSAEEPFRTRTTRDNEGVALPWPTNAMVMRGYTARGDPGQMSTPVVVPLRTQTASGSQFLVRWPAVTMRKSTAGEGGHQSIWDHLVYGYDTGNMRPVVEPLPTQTTVSGDALVGPQIDIDDCTFRMLEPKEVKGAMAFARSYVVLGNRREQIRLAGNAVTPPAARDLIACLNEAVTGESIELDKNWLEAA